MNRLRENLVELQRRIVMIEQFTEDGRDTFLSTPLIQESVIRCYEVIGEVLKKIDERFLYEQNPQIDWKAIKGFRDFLIHNYERISMTEVWRAVEHDLSKLKVTVETMLADLPDADVDEEQP